MILDPMYFIFVGPAIILSFWASYKVKSSFNKYSKVPSKKGYNGYNAAREILDKNGLTNVKIELTSGIMSDHYDPTKRVLRLSQNVANISSLASLGVAAHEAGHAIQDSKAYSPLIIRQILAPITQFSSYLSYILIFIGIIISISALTKVGIILFSAAVLFSLVTLPVEFDASSRARRLLVDYGIITKQEDLGVKKVLDAAAMTYVASAMSAVLTLLYFIIGLRSGD